MISKSIYLSILNFFGRTGNFLLYVLIANKFGASLNTDWFFLVYAIVYFIITIFIRSVESVLVPLLNKYGSNCAHMLFHTILFAGIWSVVGVTLATCFVGFILAPIGFDIQVPDHFPLSLLVCLILSVQPGLALLTSFFASYLQSNQLYTLPTLQLAFRSFGIIPILLFPWCKSILCLAFAFLIGELTRLVMLGKNTLKAIQNSKNNSAQAETFSRSVVLGQIWWIALSLSSTQLNPTIDMAMVGGLGEGSVTLVNYAEKLRGLPILALNGIFVLLLGEWSKQHQKDAIRLTFKQIARTVFTVICLTTFFLIPLILYIDTWLPTVFYSDKFTVSEINILIKLFIAYSLGIPMLAGFLVVLNALLVFQKTRLIAMVALLSTGLNIPLNLIFIKHYGIVGVAYSTACIDCIVFLIMLVSIKIVSAPPNKNTQNKRIKQVP